MMSCTEKYWHYKVNETTKDLDADESTKAFDIGKAFHHVLEHNNHSKDDLNTLLPQAKEEYNLEAEDMFMVAGMLHKYLELHLKSKLQVVHCELALTSEWFIGYIDAILVDPETGGWYICDLKTAARLSADLAQRMSKDTQLNLYAAFIDQICEKLPTLKVEDFKGCLYRVTTKVKLKRKKSETPKEYIGRVFDRADCVEYFIPAEELNTEYYKSKHLDLHAQSMRFREGEEEPVKNLNACFSYFRPCEYWSQCHDKMFSESHTSVIERRHDDF